MMLGARSWYMDLYPDDDALAPAAALIAVKMAMSRIRILHIIFGFSGIGKNSQTYQRMIAKRANLEISIARPITADLSGPRSRG